MPPLLYEDLLPTRNYLQNVCLAMSAVQRGYIPKDEHDWHYGLEVSMRGITTQDCGGWQISLDLVRHKLRIGDSNWELAAYSAQELLKNIKVWLSSHGHTAEIDEPEWTLGGNVYSPEQLEHYAEALWWMDSQFAALKASCDGGFTSPVLLYPHHFDLSLVWFPEHDERQLAVGFSTGDEHVPEPYIYVTAYPEPNEFHMLGLPSGAKWQSNGFNGAVLPYDELVRYHDPAVLLQTLTKTLFDEGATLLA